MPARRFVQRMIGLSSCLILCIETVCPPNPHFNITSFGEDCPNQCHCVNDEQCNTISGECPTGCARGWMGPGCQYRSITPNKKLERNHPPTGISTDFASSAVDGNLSTCCLTGTDLNLADNERHFWSIEFTRDFYIVGLVLYINTDDREFFRGFKVEAGQNGTNFPTMCYEHPDSPGEEVMEVMCTSPVVTRHLRVIFQVTKTRMSLCEVDIYGGRQVSFNGDTRQSSTLFTEEALNSSKAVDGRPMLRGEAIRDFYKMCSATTEEPFQIHWWQLQLPSTFRIEEIHVYSRVPAAFLYQTAGFSLNISQPGGSSPLVKYDIVINNVLKYLPREISIIPPVDGQTVTFSLTRILVLCEVEVFAECLPGWCGWDCSDVCHCSDVTTGTYRMTGVCPYGCEGRWTGTNNRCDHECKDSQWGLYCNNTCGHCHGNQPCDILNGHCQAGCKVSWKPPLCIEKCDDGTFGRDCNSTCGNCTEDGPCDKVTGSCDQECGPGLLSPGCKEQDPIFNLWIFVGGGVAGVVVVMTVGVVLFKCRRRQETKTEGAIQNADTVNDLNVTYFETLGVYRDPSINNDYDVLESDYYNSIHFTGTIRDNTVTDRAGGSDCIGLANL